MRMAAIVICGVLGTVLGALVTTLYIDFKNPDNYRDSGMPTLFIGTLFGGPPGLVLGVIVGAVWPLRNRSR
jgi:hypothetical protein